MNESENALTEEAIFMVLRFEMEFNSNLELGNFMHDMFTKYSNNLLSITNMKKIEDDEDCANRRYSVVWDKSNPNWTSDEDYNRMFIRMQMKYFNEKLKTAGHLFLNDVYKALGFPCTAEGQVVGWLYRPNDPDHFGDNCVDYEVLFCGLDGMMTLNFNVDGYILDKLK